MCRNESCLATGVDHLRGCTTACGARVLASLGQVLEERRVAHREREAVAFLQHAGEQRPRCLVIGVDTRITDLQQMTLTLSID